MTCVCAWITTREQRAAGTDLQVERVSFCSSSHTWLNVETSIVGLAAVTARPVQVGRYERRRAAQPNDIREQPV